jgi:transposase
MMKSLMSPPTSVARKKRRAPAPLQVLPKIKATESLLAHIIESKLHHRQPLYHSVGISRETMARWMIQLITPLINLMKEGLIDYDIASLDATSLQGLKEPGRSASTQPYAYCMRGGPPLQPVIVYAYNHEQHKSFVDTYFEGFKGHVHMDADLFKYYAAILKRIPHRKTVEDYERLLPWNITLD